jgi:hypothetical protein
MEKKNRKKIPASSPLVEQSQQSMAPLLTIASAIVVRLRSPPDNPLTYSLPISYRKKKVSMTVQL